MFLVRQTATGRDPTSCIQMISVIRGCNITLHALISLLFPLPSLPPLPFPRSFPSPSLRLKIFSTPRAKCLYFVRRLQSGLTLPSSAPSTSTGSAMTNQERPSLQVKYEHGKPHSSALRYGTVLTFCSMYTNGLLKV